MQPRNVFLTGVTGYIGGDVLFAITEKLSSDQFRISALIRDRQKAEAVARSYPAVRQILGDLGNTYLLREEAAKADVVIHCASLDDLASTNAIVEGLARRNRPEPAFLIAISGTDSLTWETIDKSSYGEAGNTVYDDSDQGLEHLANIPSTAPHRDVELAQLAAANHNIKIAIVSGSCIYGRGRGPCNRRSIQLPDMASYTLRNGAAFRINQGLNRWPNVHIHDFSDIFVRLMDAALRGGGQATWSDKGYYFAENGTHVWNEIANQIAHEAHRQGLIESPTVVTLAPSQADKEMPDAALFYGTDSVCRALRARDVLGWAPSQKLTVEDITVLVTDEARRLGLNALKND